MKKYITVQNVTLVLSVIAATVLAIIFSSIMTWLIYLSAVLGIMSSKTATEGKWTTFIFDILSYGIYIYYAPFKFITEKWFFRAS